MAYLNNEPSYVNGDSISGQDFHGLNSNREVIHSNLQPTSAEFRPLSSNNGAIRKEPQRHSYNKHKGPRYSSYGSGRTFSNSRGQKQFFERQDQAFARDNFTPDRQQKEPLENTFGNSYNIGNHNGDTSGNSYSNSSSNYQGPNYNYQYRESSNNYGKNSSYGNYRKENNREFDESGSGYKKFNKPAQPTRSFNYNNNRFRKDYNNYGRKKVSYSKNNRDAQSSFDVDSNGAPTSSKEEQNNFVEDYKKTEESDYGQYNASYRSSYNNNYSGNKFSRKNGRDSGTYSNFSKSRAEKNVIKNNKGK